MNDFSPDELEAAHKHCIRNYDECMESDWCGCFYCLKIFEPTEIVETCKELDGCLTAQCPHCSIDSVLGDKSGFLIDKDFLFAMRDYYFVQEAVKAELYASWGLE